MFEMSVFVLILNNKFFWICCQCTWSTTSTAGFIKLKRWPTWLAILFPNKFSILFCSLMILLNRCGYYFAHWFISVCWHFLLKYRHFRDICSNSFSSLSISRLHFAFFKYSVLDWRITLKLIFSLCIARCLNWKNSDLAVAFACGDFLPSSNTTHGFLQLDTLAHFLKSYLVLNCLFSLLLSEFLLIYLINIVLGLITASEACSKTIGASHWFELVLFKRYWWWSCCQRIYCTHIGWYCLQNFCWITLQLLTWWSGNNWFRCILFENHWNLKLPYFATELFTLITRTVIWWLSWIGLWVGNRLRNWQYWNSDSLRSNILFIELWLHYRFLCSWTTSYR